MPLDPQRHGSKSLKRMTSFPFARKTNSVPINGVEFPFVMRHYPIVFTAGERPNPVAVLGVRTDKNLFVNEWGGWTDGLYVPAYIRRYPFIFMEDASGERLILCVDEETNLLVDDSKRPLFADGKPTDVVTLTAVAVVLIATTMIAAWIPARRATIVDPVVALRD